MARYGQAFKDKAVARLLPPESASVETVSRELSISTATLERWRADALSKPARERAWTAPARFEAVLVTAAMDEASKSAWCRENGVYPQELEHWRVAATQALADPEDPDQGSAPDRPGHPLLRGGLGADVWRSDRQHPARP